MKFSIKAKALILALVFAASAALPLYAADSERKKSPGGFNYYFGIWHGHHYATKGGDDGGYSRPKGRKKFRNPENTAKKAYETAFKNGCDFYAVTPHSHITKQEEYDAVIRDAGEVNKKHKGKFLALYGQEWGEIRLGNHVNVMGSKTICHEPLGRFDLFYDKWLPKVGDVEFVQFNHPHIGRAELDYGWDDYGGSNPLLAATDYIVQSITIIPGLKQSAKGYKRHANTITLYYYLDFLNRGWHVSPTADDDNHRDDWGAMIAARNVVLADDLTSEAIYEAVRKHRVYATEDDEMIVAFNAEINVGTLIPMGSIVPIKGSMEKVSFKCSVDQVKGMDNDPIDEGDYKLELMADLDGKGGEKAKVVDTAVVKRGEVHVFQRHVIPGQYYLLHVKEKSGKDNGGHNDDAYTSPIWFEKE